MLFTIVIVVDSSSLIERACSNERTNERTRIDGEFVYVEQQVPMGDSKRGGFSFNVGTGEFVPGGAKAAVPVPVAVPVAAPDAGDLAAELAAMAAIAKGEAVKEEVKEAVKEAPSAGDLAAELAAMAAIAKGGGGGGGGGGGNAPVAAAPAVPAVPAAPAATGGAAAAPAPPAPPAYTAEELAAKKEHVKEVLGRIDAEDGRQHMNVVFIGHVDAGKSTTAGQILFLTGGVDDRTIEKYEREAKEKNRESWYMAYIMDTNEEERAKGKTVEVGRAHFETVRRRRFVRGCGEWGMGNGVGERGERGETAPPGLSGVGQAQRAQRIPPQRAAHRGHQQYRGGGRSHPGRSGDGLQPDGVADALRHCRHAGFIEQLHDAGRLSDQHVHLWPRRLPVLGFRAGGRTARAPLRRRGGSGHSGVLSVLAAHSTHRIEPFVAFALRRVLVVRLRVSPR